MHPLTGPREKLTRAQELFGELKKATGAFTRTNQHEIVIAELERGGASYALRVRVSSAPPLGWGVIIGEIVHDLRSCLDQAIWQAIIANGKDPDKLRPKPEFPVYLIGKSGKSRVPSFESEGRRRLQGVEPGLQKAIERLQPYHRGNHFRNNSLWVLQELNNADKHRLIQTAAVSTARNWSNFTFGNEAPSGITHQEIRRRIQFYGNRPLVDGTKVGRIDANIPDVKSIKVLPITQIVFSEAPENIQGLAAAPVIEHLGRHVARVLFREFTPFFPPLPPEWSTTPDP